MNDLFTVDRQGQRTAMEDREYQLTLGVNTLASSAPIYLLNGRP